MKILMKTLFGLSLLHFVCASCRLGPGSGKRAREAVLFSEKNMTLTKKSQKFNNFDLDRDVIEANFADLLQVQPHEVKLPSGQQALFDCLARSDISPEFEFGQARCLDGSGNLRGQAIPIRTKHLRLGCPVNPPLGVLPRQPLERLTLPEEKLCASIELELFLFEPSIRYRHDSRE